MTKQLKIALVQTSLHWQDIRANLAHFESKLNTVTEADLVVFPEMFTTGFSMASEDLAETMQGQSIQWLEKQAKKHNFALCGSLIIEESGAYFNRFVYQSPQSDRTIYDKKHLFRMSTENENYSAGKERVTFDLKGFSICPQVCYDLRFPVWSRNTQSYDLLLYVANWPATRRLHWLSLLQARAIENQTYVVGVNRIGLDGNDIRYSGDTVVFDFNGELVCNLKDADEIQMFTLDKQAQDQYREAFPAWKDADKFCLAND